METVIVGERVPECENEVDRDALGDRDKELDADDDGVLLLD